MLGFAFAVISSLFYSLYVVPRKFSKLSAVVFSFYMACAFFASSLILYSFQPLLQFHETISFTLWWSVIAGSIWATAFVCFVKAIDLLGLSRSNQWKNLQGPIAVVLSLIILQEFATTNPTFVIGAALTIFLSALCFTIPQGKERHEVTKGIFLAVLSAFGFGIVAVIQKHVTTEVGVYSQLVVWSFAIAVSLAIYLLFTKQISKVFQNTKKEMSIGILAGIIYLGASLFQIFSYNYLEASITFTVVQLSALWTVLIGIFIFKEINFRQHYKRVLLGLLLTIIGIAFLVFARK